MHDSRKVEGFGQVKGCVVASGYAGIDVIRHTLSRLSDREAAPGSHQEQNRYCGEKTTHLGILSTQM